MYALDGNVIDVGGFVCERYQVYVSVSLPASPHVHEIAEGFVAGEHRGESRTGAALAVLAESDADHAPVPKLFFAHTRK